MKYITTYLSVALVALFVSQAQSQYIEIRYEVTATDHSFHRFGRSVLVFDTSVAPEQEAGGIQTYYAITGQYYADESSRHGTPFKVLREEVNIFENAELTYNPNDQSMKIRTRPVAGRWMDIVVNNMSNDFFKGMGSLPNAPESYAMEDDFDLSYVEADFGNPGSSWAPKDGFSNGAVTYGARLVTELEPEACSPADLNQDGIVDFFDISIFIQLFMQGCP